eukprot:gene5297-10214_t
MLSLLRLQALVLLLLPLATGAFAPADLWGAGAALHDEEEPWTSIPGLIEDVM